MVLSKNNNKSGKIKNLTPSPINKYKNKFAIASENLMINLRNNNKNLRDSNKMKSMSNLKNRCYSIKDNKNNIHDDSQNNISIIDNRNKKIKESIDKTIKKALNISKSNYQFSNNNMIYMNFNSREEKEDIRKDTKEKFFVNNYKNNQSKNYYYSNKFNILINLIF
jgi:hypothetical protein